MSRELNAIELRAAETARSVLTFEERYEEICYWVDKRRRRLDLQTLAWEDCRSIIVTRVWEQYGMFDPAVGEFRKWVNKVITRAICNIWRDNLSTWSRPCITGKGGCTDNMGGNLCRRTPSGLQCAECPAFREWEARKGDQFAIMQPLPLDNHTQQVKSSPSAYVDYPEKMEALHKRMKKRLTRTEWRAYRLLIVQHKEEEDVARALGFKAKRGKKQRMYPGYLALLSMRHKFIEIAREELEKMAA